MLPMSCRVASVTTGARIERIHLAFRTAEAMPVIGIANVGGTTRTAITAPLVPFVDGGVFCCPATRRDR